jgi:hypothetical protein
MLHKNDKIIIAGGAGLVSQNLIVRLKKMGFSNLVAIEETFFDPEYFDIVLDFWMQVKRA